MKEDVLIFFRCTLELKDVKLLSIQAFPFGKLCDGSGIAYFPPTSEVIDRQGKYDFYDESSFP